MTLPPGSDLLLSRDRASLLAQILAVRTAYVPDWLPALGGAGHGLADVLAGHLELLQQRLAQVPTHRQAILLDLLGVSVLPAQGARTHVVMTAVPGTRGARVPLGTRMGANVPGRDAPVVFETQDTVTISPATVVEVHSVLPTEDAEQDHSADVLARRPFTVFGDLARVERDLYVGHDELLAFDGRAVVEIEIGVGVPAPQPFSLDWSWWDGMQWRAFAPMVASVLAAGDDDSVDGTAGLTRSGTVRLVAPCATSKPQDLDGQTTHWVRGRLSKPLDLQAGAPLPSLSRLRLAVVNEHRRLRVQRSTSGTLGVHPWWPEHSADKVTLLLKDVTTATSSSTDVATEEHALRRLAAKDPTAEASHTVTVPADHVVRVGVSAFGRRAPLSAPVPKDQPRPKPPEVRLQEEDDLTDPVRLAAGERVDVTVARGLPLDKAIADLRAADLTKTFAPLGPSPALGTAFLFASSSATARPGARVSLVIERGVSASEEADDVGGGQQAAVDKAKDLLTAAIGALEGGTISGALSGASTTLAAPLPELLNANAGTWYSSVRSQVARALGDLKDAVAPNHAAWTRIGTALTRLDQFKSTGDPDRVDDAIGELGSARPQVARVLVEIARAVEELALNGASVADERATLEAAIGAGTPGPIATAEAALHAALVTFLGTAAPWLPAATLPPIFHTDPTAFVTQVAGRLSGARGSVDSARTAITGTVTTLKEINAQNLVTAIVPAATNRLEPPVIAWEYHDGERWRPLGVTGDPEVLSLQASGSLHFTVPDDISDVDVDGDVRRWLRARLAKGSYSNLRLISWTDTDGAINYLPVVEPRAPMVDRIEVFYRHRSEVRDAGAVLAHDDHAWRDLTTALTWPAPGGSPFVPMPETAPTLYVGFDGELPAERVSLWLQLADSSPWAIPQRPVWEGFDGREWVRLAVDDGTDGLRRTGVVGLLWPGTAGAPGVTVSGARGRTVSLLGRGAALRFSPGDRLMLADLLEQEPLVVATADGETVTTRDPLKRAYAGARLSAAPPARFGTPRTWVRAVFDPTRPPPVLAFAGLAPHAAEVAQVETLRDELIGSGDGSPGQVLAARRFPVAGDVDLEVRELDGDRADLDADVLTRTLAADGADPATVRLVRDTRTGRVTEVWVQWTPTPSLGSAGPHDRVYVLDHAQGRFVFGGNGHGRPLPEARDNVRLRSYRTCEGMTGNVGPGTLTNLLSAVAVSEVTNREAATGGADVEPLAAALTRGPGLLRHRRLALTEADVEAIAVEASPAVVRARAVGATDRYGRPQAGSVRVIVVARDGSARPTPGAALLSTVRDAVAAASPAVAVRRVTVEGPAYLPVGVRATVLPQREDDAGPVRERVLRALEAFMHPLGGGPTGTGWDFGAAVHLSDLAGVLEAVPGVDAVTDLVLLRDDVPAGDTVPARVDQVVCAGPLTVRLGGGG